MKALAVLIESDWNLKGISLRSSRPGINVLIESDWNLKWTGYQRELNKGELY